MATKVTPGMNWDEYCNYTLSGKRTELKTYLRGRSYYLPAPYNKRTTKKEAEILAECKLVLDGMKLFYQRIDVAGKIINGRLVPSPMVGMPDIIGCYEGNFIGIECKAAGGTISCEQLAKLKALQSNGATVCVCVDPTKLALYIKDLYRTPYHVEGIAIL